MKIKRYSCRLSGVVQQDAGGATRRGAARLRVTPQVTPVGSQACARRRTPHPARRCAPLHYHSQFLSPQDPWLSYSREFTNALAKVPWWVRNRFDVAENILHRTRGGRKRVIPSGRRGGNGATNPDSATQQVSNKQRRLRSAAALIVLKREGCKWNSCVRAEGKCPSDVWSIDRLVDLRGLFKACKKGSCWPPVHMQVLGDLGKPRARAPCGDGRRAILV